MRPAMRHLRASPPLSSSLWRSWTQPNPYRRPIQTRFLSKISLFEKIQILVELLVPACADALDFQPLEFLQQPPLAVGRQARLGHRKEDVVFLEYVRIQKRAVVARARNHHGRGRAITRAMFLPRGGHLPDQGAAVLMLAQHHADRPAVPGDAGRFEGGEEKLLLLAVMALVGKDLDELQHLAEMLRIDLPAVVKPLA